jgi:hypothetical protein
LVLTLSPFVQRGFKKKGHARDWISHDSGIENGYEAGGIKNFFASPKSRSCADRYALKE